MLPTSSRLLPTRTGSAPLRKYVVPPSPLHHDSKVSQLSPLHSPTFLKNSTSVPDLSRTTQFSSKVCKPGQVSISSRVPISSKPSLDRSLRMTLPGTFLPPREQHRLGLDWVSSNHNTKFNPPMPKTFPTVCAIYKRKREKNDSFSKTNL